jgi:hypothetical protein
MASILDDVRVYLRGADLACSLTHFSAGFSADEKDVTTFRQLVAGADSTPNTAKMLAGGLMSTAYKLAGNSEAGSDADEDRPDDLFSESLGGVEPITFSRFGGDFGDTATVSKMLTTKWMVGGKPGDVWSYDIEGSGHPAYRGVYALPVTVTAVDVEGSAISVSGGLAAGSRIIANFHVLATPGTAESISFAIESDSTDEFLTPTTIETTSAFLLPGGEQIEVILDEELTDEYLRVTATIADSDDGTFVAVAALALRS